MLVTFFAWLLVAQQISGITFDEVDRQFGPGGALTDLQKREAWKAYRGKCVRWTGELVYVDESFLGDLSVGFRHKKMTLTYDVLVRAPRSARQQLMQLRQGARYEYTATLRNYGGAILPISADWGCR